MFPEETHEKILKRIDDIECELYSLYRRTASLRLELQKQWHVLPTSQRWSPAEQEKAEEAVR